jgi:putative AdoMet-dependent methyltransferase
MRSRFADTFNHDADAPDYDVDVQNEAHPVRAGYAELLAWVVRSARIEARHDVLELGAGTGNLTRLLPPSRRVVAVDVSAAMLEIAATKVGGPVEWQRDDLLEYFDGRTDRFDRFVSTYAIHHLIPTEKELLFQRIRHAANSGARVAFGDLMFASEHDRRDAIERYRHEWPDVAAAIDEEFFWNVDDCVAALLRSGFSVATHRISDLSWGMLAATID